MRPIAIIGPTAPLRGGISHFNTRLISALRERAEVLALGWSEAYPRLLTPRDFSDPSLRRFDTEHLPLLRYSSPRSWLAAARVLGRADPGRLFLHWAHPVAAPVFLALLWLLRRRTQASISLIVHNAEPHEAVPCGRLLSRLVLRRADRLIVHSEYDARRLLELGVRTPATVAFHPVYDLFEEPRASGGQGSALHPPGPAALDPRIGGGGTVLLFFGFIRRYKGLDLLLEAMPEVLREFPGATLLVAGECFWGRSEDPRPLIQRLGLGANVRLDSRYIPNEEVGGYFQAADLVVLPYRSASQSGVLQLAYALDRPVVATRVGGLPDAVEEGVSGYLAEPNPRSLAQAILRALRQPIPAESVRAYKARFGWTRYVGLLLD